MNNRSNRGDKKQLSPPPLCLLRKMTDKLDYVNISLGVVFIEVG
jgi:hypothetical protein